jgi:hypothetical protein
MVIMGITKVLVVVEAVGVEVGGEVEVEGEVMVDVVETIVVVAVVETLDQVPWMVDHLVVGFLVQHQW